MRAILNGHVIAESDDVVLSGGYRYFPPAAVQTGWLEKSERTASDIACPHAVQFYDVVIEGVRYPRAAWVYEAPRPALRQVAGRYGFWQDVEVV
jgi:uncharacterized protein (DUF427 family)